MNIFNYFAGPAAKLCPTTGFPVAPNGMPNVFHTSSVQGGARLPGLLSRAVHRTLFNINVLHQDPRSGGLSTHDLFAKMHAELQKTHPGAELYVSGGVVRSLLGHTYARLYRTHQAHLGDREKITEEVLERMGEESGRLALWDVLGIESDLDLLVDGGGISPEDVASCLGPFALPQPADNRTRSTLLYDINAYSRQMGRAIAQGGSSLDWLALSVRPDGGFRHPDSLPAIIPNFLQGRVAVLPMDGAESPPETTARLMRTFLEVPFLQPLPEHLSLTARSIEKLASDFSTLDGTTQSRVQTQFRKAVRNAPFAEACNFISVPHPNNTPLERAWRKMPASPVPEFLGNKPIQTRSDAFDPGELRAKGLLVPIEEFISGSTDGGLLYHGTPDPKNLLYIMRTGLYVSATHQGRAMYGRGFYTARDYKTAAEYSNAGNGAVISLLLNRSPHMRILRIENCPPEIIAEAEKKKQDLHQYLAEVYDIDIIINSYFLVQNTDALILPKDISQWIHNIQKPVMERISQLSETQESYDDFVKAWNEVHSSDNVSWTLYQTRPLLTHLLKTCLPWLKRDRDCMRRTMRLFEALEILSTPQFRDELRDQIHTTILHGSKKEQGIIADLRDTLLDLSIYLHISRDHSYDLIRAYLPHITSIPNSSGIVSMITLLKMASDPQLKEEIMTHVIPLLQEENPAKFAPAHRFVTAISINHYKDGGLLDNDRLIPIFSKRAEALVARGNAAELRSFVNGGPYDSFAYWIPGKEYVALLQKTFQIFVQRPDKEAQLLCMDILTSIVRSHDDRTMLDHLYRETTPVDQIALGKDLLRLLKQTPDLVAYSGTKKFCDITSSRYDDNMRPFNEDLVSMLLSIFLDSASSSETRRGAKICLSTIIDDREGVQISREHMIRLAEISGPFYLHSKSFKE